jgi:hypothetical protein
MDSSYDAGIRVSVPHLRIVGHSEKGSKLRSARITPEKSASRLERVLSARVRSGVYLRRGWSVQQFVKPAMPAAGIPQVICQDLGRQRRVAFNAKPVADEPRYYFIPV